jgi:hypothetical protein
MAEGPAGEPWRRRGYLEKGWSLATSDEARGVRLAYCSARASNEAPDC